MQIPPLFDRRSVLAAGLMLPAAAIAARIAPVDPQVNATAIRWPVGPARELHGYMAIPARARGRQPAVLIIGGGDTPDPASRALVRSTAQAGFVACTANRAAIVPERLAEDMQASAAWLANGRYGTGRIGAIGVGAGLPVMLALVARGALTAAIALDDPGAAPPGDRLLSLRRDGAGWSLLTGSGASATFAADWAQAWVAAMAYLRGQLT